jgi:hypothetical protein
MLVRDLSKGWKSAECWCDLTNGGVDIGKNHVWEESRFLTRIMSMFDLGIVATITKRNPPCGV